MPRRLLLLALALLVAPLTGVALLHGAQQQAGAPPAQDAPGTPARYPPGFRQLFNGRDLSGWEGDPLRWRVEDGAITGETSADQPLAHNTFLVWKDGAPGDFELRLKFRIFSGNSGIQYRSTILKEPKFAVGGYQADLCTLSEGSRWITGILYEEKGRGILARRGQKVSVDAGGTRSVEKFAEEASYLKGLDLTRWNDYTIICRGPHVIQKINGAVTAELMDHQEDKRRLRGVLALQLHAGPPMRVQFKDLALKEFGADEDAETPDSGGGQ